jgi:PilZ domain
MTIASSPVGVERRVGQRFPYNLPVALRDVSSASEGLGFTQDLSSRGAFLFTVMALGEGAEIELTLRMPSEITLGESMRVRCRGRVLRVVNAADNGWKSSFSTPTEAQSPNASGENNSAETQSTEIKSAEKIGVAVCLNGYEYLPETEDSSADFRRISALHSTSQTERVTAAPGIPRVAFH